MYLSNVWPFDIVDPYPRTKSGFKYILTTIYYFSRYPDVIPLKKVDEQSVASVMVKIFSSTGIPEEILTNQGCVFYGSFCEMVMWNARHYSH